MFTKARWHATGHGRGYKLTPPPKASPQGVEGGGGVEGIALPPVTGLEGIIPPVSERFAIIDPVYMSN